MHIHARSLQTLLPMSAKTALSKYSQPIMALGLLLAATPNASAVNSRPLTDDINQGHGSINLLKDISAGDLRNYLTGYGALLLGVDVSENASGNETSTSIGVALKSAALTLTTTTGTYTFSHFSTNTSAMIREAGTTTAQSFQTLFGQVGSSSIQSGTNNFDLGLFDDLMGITGISFTGDITSAILDVQLVDTYKTNVQGAETFFDYTGGAEKLALLSAIDSSTLEAAGIGLADAPTNFTTTTTTSPIDSSPTLQAAVQQESGSVSLITQAVPGAPSPPLYITAAFALVLLAKSRRPKA